MYVLILEKCDSKEGIFTCDSPVEAVEFVLKVKTRQGKHTLNEDRDRRMEKYLPWERYTDNDNGRRLDSVSPSVTSDLGPWFLTPTEFEYKPKIFNDPRNVRSDKENMPPLEPVPMPVLNLVESNFLD